MEKMAKDYVTLSEKSAAISAENKLELRRESARVSCITLAEASAHTSKADEVAKNMRERLGVGKTSDKELVGSKSRNDWNYKETITSTFDWENLVCHRCVRTQNCAEPRQKKWCKKWNEEQETCKDIQF